VKEQFRSLTTLCESLMKRDLWVVSFIVLFAFFLRLKGLHNTPTDWHAFRQADTASVTREYVKHGVDLLHPKYQDLSNIASGKDNLEGYRMVEFPFLNAGVAVLVRHFPGLDLVVTSRFIALLFSLGTVVGIYYLGKTWSSQSVGVAAAVTFALLPYARFYSRAILPEAPFICFTTLSILFFQWWVIKRQWQTYVGAVVCLMLATLLKPFVLFLGPLFLLIALKGFGKKIIFRYELVIFVVLAVLPFMAWREWIKQYPSGIPANDWLFNGDGIRFRPAWFRWLFFERLTKLILGWVGVPFMVIGVLPKMKNWLNYIAWWLCILIYFSVIATGNVRHDYYQVFLLPIISLTVGVGIVRLIEFPLTARRKIGMAVLAAVLLIAAVKISGTYVEGYYSTRPDWEKAGEAADKLLPPDAKVIAPAFGDTAFLFQTNRTGWPIGFEIEKKIKLGAQYYVTTSYDDEARELEKTYPTVAKTSDYLILRLQ
jgi:hypothetical protein